MVCVLASVRTFSQPAIQKVDRFLSGEFPSNKPGAVVLIAKRDTVLYRKAFGLASVEKSIAMRPDMIFQIASMTKQFTAAAIVQLAEHGKLSTDDPIQKYLEKYPGHGHTITINHLLTQTSGIPEFFDPDESEKHLLVKEHTPWDLISYFKDRPLDFEPGTKFAYSNSNYVLLGAIIEKVSGISYSEYMDQFIFTPIGMKNTSVWYKPSSPAEAIVQGHPNVSISGSVVYSSGGMVSTVDDLYTWTKYWVKTKSSLFQNEGYHYGLNVTKLQGSKAIQHGGNLFGFTSSGIYLPKEEIYVCILSNAVFRGTEMMVDYIASEMINKPVDVPSKDKAASGDLTEYTGVYRLQNSTRTMKIIITAHMLVLTFPDQPGSGADVQPVGTDTFESKKVKAKLTFTRDEKGRVKQVDVKQGKGSYTWVKES